MSRIAAVDVTRVRVPLAEPYHLSHTTVRHFDTVLVELERTDGCRGIGEATPLQGYSTATSDESWSRLTDIAPELVGETRETAQRLTEEKLAETPFTCCAVNCALETARSNPVPGVSAPIIGILSTKSGTDELLSSLQSQVAAGLKTVKVKVGFDPKRDAKRLKAVLRAAPADISFRVDANQGYTLAETREFLDGLPTGQLQLLEQPLPVGNLSKHAILNQDYGIELMLDEEIQSRDDVIATARANAAGAVKFKLMKVGGWTGTRRCIRTAQDLGLDVVLGNGVQSDVGCIHEAVIWDETDLELAGEFNGWRKQKRQLSTQLRFADGKLQWKGGEISLEKDRLQAYCVDQKRYGQ